MGLNSRHFSCAVMPWLAHPGGTTRRVITSTCPGDRNTPSCLVSVRAYTLFPMPYFEFLWTNENTAHIAEHGVSQADFEAVVLHSVNRGISRRSLLPVA